MSNRLDQELPQIAWRVSSALSAGGVPVELDAGAHGARASVAQAGGSAQRAARGRRFQRQISGRSHVRAAYRTRPLQSARPRRRLLRQTGAQRVKTPSVI